METFQTFQSAFRGFCGVEVEYGDELRMHLLCTGETTTCGQEVIVGMGNLEETLFLPNEPVSFSRIFQCITFIYRYLCGLQRVFANGFVLEKRTHFGGA